MHRNKPRKLWQSLLAAVFCLAPGTALSADSELNFELNNASDVAGACRVSFLVENKLASPIEALKIELVLFDKEGQVNRLLSVNFGRMPLNKSRLKQFDLTGLPCSQIGRLLLNNVTECKGQNLTPTSCTDAVKTSSRVQLKLSY